MSARVGGFETGDVVSVRFSGVLRHYGVVTSRGTVLSNSGAHGGVIEQSMADFAKGRRVVLREKGGGLEGVIAEQRARSRIAGGYDLTGSNCIDYVRHSRRRSATPWQYARAAGMALGDMLGGKRRY